MNDGLQKLATHKAHCCSKHGCKYSELDCPVVSHEIESEGSCLECDAIIGLEIGELKSRNQTIVMIRSEVSDILKENIRLKEQVTDLQKSLTLKEEILRAHRRVQLDPFWKAALEKDIQETTNRVIAGYESPKNS